MPSTRRRHIGQRLNCSEIFANSSYTPGIVQIPNDTVVLYIIAFKSKTINSPLNMQRSTYTPSAPLVKGLGL